MTSLTVTDPTALAITEARLGDLEARVRDGLKSFVEVGQALIEIRDGRGYKLRGYRTFEAYCEKVFGFTDRHGRRMIAAAQTAQAVQEATGRAPANESVARVLTAVAAKPDVLQKVEAQLEKKKTSIAQAPAEVVADAVAAVQGKLRPKPAAPAAPKNGRAKPADPEAPASLEAQMAALVVERDKLLEVVKFYANEDVWDGRLGDGGRYAREALDEIRKARKEQPATPQKPAAAKCPHCKSQVQPGDALCNTCGEAL